MESIVENIKNIIDACDELIRFNNNSMSKADIDMAKAVAFDHIKKVIKENEER